MSAYRVGLTGGLAAGKSTVGGWLAEVGFCVVDADRFVSEIYEPNAPGAKLVSELFGPSMLDDEGRVDRSRLAALVFKDSTARQQLERAIHPLIKNHFESVVRQSGATVVLEAGILVEAGFAPMFDLIITVEAEPEIRLKRAIERGLDPESAQDRIRSQTTTEARVAAADLVIWNNGSLEEMSRQVDSLVNRIREGGELGE